MREIFKTIYYILKSLRPRHWTKNLFIFAGIIFSKHLLDFYYLKKVILAFLIFSIISGCGYIINDLKDKERDKFHPKKSKRPIASGKISSTSAIISVFILLPVSLFLSFLLEKKFFIATSSYILLDIIYTFYLKNIVILGK